MCVRVLLHTPVSLAYLPVPFASVGIDVEVAEEQQQQQGVAHHQLGRRLGHARAVDEQHLPNWKINKHLGDYPFGPQVSRPLHRRPHSPFLGLSLFCLFFLLSFLMLWLLLFSSVWFAVLAPLSLSPLDSSLFFMPYLFLSSSIWFTSWAHSLYLFVSLLRFFYPLLIFCTSPFFMLYLFLFSSIWFTPRASLSLSLRFSLSPLLSLPF